MASDCDGKSSSSILRSIREKLVVYKESLLRQLVDEREAALATKEKGEREDVNEIEVNSVGNNASALSVDSHSQQEDADVEPRVKVEVLDPSANVCSGARDESYVKGCATDERFNAEGTQENNSSKKRRLVKAEMNGTSQAEQDGGLENQAKRKRQTPGEMSYSPSKRVGVKEIEPKREVDVAKLPEVGPLGTPYRVDRTSIPPTKYLVQKQRDQDASDREAVRQQHPVVLLATATSNGGTGMKRPTTISRKSPGSVDTTNTEFERKLRESVSLYREVNRRSLNVTRKRQLPRLTTPIQGKSHWDFLLEEMKWMATDFSQERNWKRVLQYRLAADAVAAQNSGIVRREIDNRHLARGIGLQISAFWRIMERIAARSRVRFEATGTEHSALGNSSDDSSLGGHTPHLEDDRKQERSEDVEMVDIGDDMLALKYHTQDAAAVDVIDSKSDGKVKARADAVLISAKAHVSFIVSAGKRARSAITPSLAESARFAAWSQREAAFRDLQARCAALQAKGGPTIILAAFQLLALRWMLDLYSSGLNMLLNDQFGMGKAATIVAFFSLIEIVSSQEQQQGDSPRSTPVPHHTNRGRQKGPHLIVASNEELHKWRHYLRIWHLDRRIQLYDGAGQASHYREKLQQEWKYKLSVPTNDKGEDDFLFVSPNEYDEGFDDDELTEPVYCVLCPVDAFIEDRQAFVNFAYWQMVVVENDHGDQFDDPICVSALQQLRQQQRRILCNGIAIENWKNTASRLQYAEFLVREAPSLNTTSVCECSQHRIETWPVEGLQVERSSVAKVMQAYGKSSSVRAALWKAASQQEETPKYMNALLLALSCLSLRRVRSEVEQELCKIEEISLSCQLSISQSTQYRNALSGFAATLASAGGREDRLGVWLQLLLRLRQICNCVDLVNDMEKLGHADLRLLTSCSAKLETLEPLLRRLVLQESKKVVIYCQFHGMFPVLELFLSLLDISYVHITGSIAMQRRSLCHFAGRPVVRVALASTRLSAYSGGQAVSLFGSEAIVVVDGDWNATCDAKLRASWARMAVGVAESLPVYRIHCENTVEASLLRVGALLTEKVFSEMTPQELLAVPSDMTLTIIKPSWWSSNTSISGLAGSGAAEKLASVAQQVERTENYCGSPGELEAPLIVHDVDLDAEEHLLLANTDELTPVEWYAVNYIHGVTDNRHQQGEGKTVERLNELESIEVEETSQDETNLGSPVAQHSLEKQACLEANRQWQQGDAVSQLFFNFELHNDPVNESALEKLFMQIRMQGMETHFDVYKPPQLRNSLDNASSKRASNDDTQMTFRISYRVPKHVPQTGKSKLDCAVEQHGDLSKPKSSKKQRTSAANMARAGIPTTNSSANSTGVKRKLESQLGGIKSGPHKEQRVDLEGIPVPDISELADDDFWGDTNLDALDSADWDDPALLGGILGVGVGSSVTGATSSSSAPSSGAGVSAASGANTTTGMAFGDAGQIKLGSQKNFKKSKSGTARVRKSSMSSSDSARDVWSVQDDMLLKKLFELYGPNWTLIAQVFNSTTAVSRFVCRKRSPRQCYDRYGKIISGNLTTVATGAFSPATVKDGKPAVWQKGMRVSSVATAQQTRAMLDARIGMTPREMLAKFPQRDSLPGLPPPSIVSPPSLISMMVAHRQQPTQRADNAAADKNVGAYSNVGGLDELKSIKISFDAIIQCMKHKTSPPPIPIPVGANATALGATAASAALELGTRTSLATAPMPSSQVLSNVSAPSTPTKASALAPNKATVSPATTTKAIPVVPPPHKSHTDMIALLPGAVLGPDEVIKRSKEAAVVAVQAATAVASVGRDGSPLSASGDVMLGAGSGFGVSVSSSMPRRSHAASRTSDLSAVGVVPTSAIPSPGPANGCAASTAMSVGAQPQTPKAATTTAWGDMVQSVNSSGLNASASMDLATLSGKEPERSAPMPVTTSTLLHVLDRMPEIKNKIQSILNRTDCSESQKVAMIARLLSNTNAISNTNALGASAPMPSSDASVVNTSAVLSALTAESAVLNSPEMLVNSERAIPMPASLNAPPTSAETSAALTLQGQQQQPTK